MAQIAHAFAQQTTAQTTTSTTFQTALTLASGNFTAGKKYLLWAACAVNSSSGTSTHRAEVRVTHGSTAFDDSLRYETPSITTEWQKYTWFHVWTAVSSEAINIEFRSGNAASTASVDQLTLFALCLSDDLVENTDWHFSEDSLDQALNATTAESGAAVAFTPATADQKWFVATLAQIQPSSSTISYASRLARSDEATQLHPESIIEVPNSTNTLDILVSPCVFTLGTNGNTFTEESLSYGGDAHTRLHSKAFAMRLDGFADAQYVYTPDDSTDVSSTAWGTQVQTLTFTPSVEAPFWVGAWAGLDKGGQGPSNFLARMQIDNTDTPDTQTSDAYVYRSSTDGRDEEHWDTQIVTTLTAASHTIDVDMSNPGANSGTQSAQYRLIWAVSMELASTITSHPGSRLAMLGIG